MAFVHSVSSGSSCRRQHTYHCSTLPCKASAAAQVGFASAGGCAAKASNPAAYCWHCKARRVTSTASTTSACVPCCDHQLAAFFLHRQVSATAFSPPSICYCKHIYFSCFARPSPPPPASLDSPKLALRSRPSHPFFPSLPAPKLPALLMLMERICEPQRYFSLFLTGSQKLGFSKPQENLNFNFC